MVTILGDHGVNHHTVTGQARVDDTCRLRRGTHTAFFAKMAGALLAFGDQYEVFGWFDSQLFTLLVANHHHFLSTSSTGALFGCARKDFFLAWQVCRQRLSPRMFAL